MVTGGRGLVGRLVTPLPLAARHEVTVTSRRRRPAPAGTSLRMLDLGGDRLPGGALAGIDVVVHAAINPVRARAVDVRGIGLLLAEARSADVAHLIYLSIVGVDEHPFPYYRAEAAAEATVETGGTPHSILRATPFHEFLDRIFRTGPFITVFPGFEFQVIDGEVVADRVVELVADGPQGRVSDLSGPRAEPMEGMARSWKVATGSPKSIVRVPGLRPGRPLLSGGSPPHRQPGGRNPQLGRVAGGDLSEMNPAGTAAANPGRAVPPQVARR